MFLHAVLCAMCNPAAPRPTREQVEITSFQMSVATLDFLPQGTDASVLSNVAFYSESIRSSFAD